MSYEGILARVRKESERARRDAIRIRAIYTAPDGAEYWATFKNRRALGAARRFIPADAIDWVIFELPHDGMCGDTIAMIGTEHPRR